MDVLYLLGLRIHVRVYLLTYLHSWLFAYKTGNISETVERKLLLTANIKSYAGFWLPTKCMTLNDPWPRFKITDSLKAAKNDEIQLSNNSDAM